MNCLKRAIVVGAMLLGLQSQFFPALPVQGNAEANIVKTYRVFELTLQAASPGSNPYVDGPAVAATFSGVSGPAAGQSFSVQGFWDGGDVWKVRFAPPLAGEWRYTTSSADAGLDGAGGSLTAIAPTPEELAANPLLHVFLQADGFAWKLSDGAPFLPVGDTQWSFSEENTTSEWERWMSARQRQGFNTFLGSVWLAIYDRPEASGPAFANADPKSDKLQAAFFQRLDHLVQYANDHGIMMGLAIGGFPDNSDWFDRFGSRERNDRWFRYVVARYSAYNVRWVLYGEGNERNPPWGGTWQDEVKYGAGLVREVDPYDHPIGSHHQEVDSSSAGDGNIDYVEVQADRTEQQYQIAEAARKYGKPIWFEEYWYEPEEYDDEVTLGIRNTHRNFVAQMAFPTMGSLMRGHHPNFDVNEVEMDPGAVRMCYFANFYNGLDYRNFSPASSRVNRGQAGKFGSDYAIFLQGGGSVTLDLSGESDPFTVEALDINSGKMVALTNIAGGGKHTINTGSTADTALLVLRGAGAQENLMPESAAQCGATKRPNVIFFEFLPFLNRPVP